jgi:hypothetical protein
LSDAEIEAALEVDMGFIAPHGLAQFFAGDDLAVAGEEAGERLCRLGLKGGRGGLRGAVRRSRG